MYHCLWFVAGNPANAELFEPWTEVRAYMERMQAFGHGRFAEISGEAALAIGTDAEPVTPKNAGLDLPGQGFALGDAVTVAPNDYGRIPVAGQLVSYRYNEIVVARADAQAGEVMVHFPNIGFEITAA